MFQLFSDPDPTFKCRCGSRGSDAHLLAIDKVNDEVKLCVNSFNYPLPPPWQTYNPVSRERERDKNALNIQKRTRTKFCPPSNTIKE